MKIPGVHRQDDDRYCGAKTVVTNQTKVFANFKLVAVEDDECDHGEGKLVQVYGRGSIYVNFKKLICAPGDQAEPDLIGHPVPPTDPKTSSATVKSYEGGSGGGSS